MKVMFQVRRESDKLRVRVVPVELRRPRSWRFFVIHIFSMISVGCVGVGARAIKAEEGGVLKHRCVFSLPALLQVALLLLFTAAGSARLRMYGYIPRVDDGHSLDFALLRPPLCVQVYGTFVRLCQCMASKGKTKRS